MVVPPLKHLQNNTTFETDPQSAIIEEKHDIVKQEETPTAATVGGSFVLALHY